MNSRLLYLTPGIGLLGIIVISAFLALAAALLVPETGIEDAIVQDPITANDLKPAECASLNLTNIVEGSGTINGTANNDLILGSSSADTIDGGQGDDCIVGGDLGDVLHGGSGNSIGTVRDEFNAVSYANNDGTENWSGDWMEVGESDGAASGDVNVELSAARGLYKLWADQDSWIEENNPGNNYGTAAELKVKPNAGDMKHALYRFDLSTLPAGSNISSATAYFWVTQSNANPVDVHRITDAWTETGVTWNNTAADYDTTANGTFTPGTNGQYVEVDVTALVQEWVDGAAPNHGLMFRASASAGETKYRSREQGGTDQDPYLAVEVSTGGGTNTVFADQDSWLEENNPGNNYGTAAELKTRLKSADELRALYRFDLSTIPTGASVTSATAYFWVSVENANLVNVHRVTDDWTETGVTWNNTAADYDSTPDGSFTPSTASQFVAVNITALVQEWVDGTSPNYGLTFIGTVSDQESRTRSREQGGTDQDPYLEIVLAPGGSAQALRIQNADKAAWRQADLTGASAAELHFEYRRDSLDDAADYVALELSNNGGSSWTDLNRFQGPATDSGNQLILYDISSYIASNTAIRFLSSSSLGDKDRLYVDDVHVNILVSSGSGGDDVLLGGAGDDSLTGGDGTDVCTGGPGINSYDPSCEIQN